jgi:hypothetical protein
MNKSINIACTHHEPSMLSAMTAMSQPQPQRSPASIFSSRSRRRPRSQTASRRRRSRKKKKSGNRSERSLSQPTTSTATLGKIRNTTTWHSTERQGSKQTKKNRAEKQQYE